MINCLVKYEGVRRLDTTFPLKQIGQLGFKLCISQWEQKKLWNTAASINTSYSPDNFEALYYNILYYGTRHLLFSHSHLHWLRFLSIWNKLYCVFLPHPKISAWLWKHDFSSNYNCTMKVLNCHRPLWTSSLTTQWLPARISANPQSCRRCEYSPGDATVNPDHRWHFHSAGMYSSLQYTHIHTHSNISVH